MHSPSIQQTYILMMVESHSHPSSSLSIDVLNNNLLSCYKYELSVNDMATKSFFEDMVIDTEEAADRLWEAFEEADSGVPGIDTTGAQKPVRDPKEIRRIMGW